MQHNAAHNPAMGWEAANPEYKSPRLKTIDPLELDGEAIPPRRWLVDGWIPMGAVTMLAGDGGVGKSLLAMQLATACAIGQPWLGQHTMSCKPGSPVIKHYIVPNKDAARNAQAARGRNVK